MSTYYVIRSSSEPKIVGIRDGGSQATARREIASDIEKTKALYEFTSHGPDFYDHLGTFPAKDFNLEGVYLERGAKLTDFMSFDPSYPGMKFLVNEKVIHILTAHHLPPYKLYDVALTTKQGINNDYKLFYCPPLKNDIVDFSKTILSPNLVVREEKLFTVPDDNALKELKEKKMILTVSLALNNKFDQSLDLFGTQVEYNMYISQRLKDALQSAGCVGVNIVPPFRPELIV